MYHSRSVGSTRKCHSRSVTIVIDTDRKRCIIVSMIDYTLLSIQNPWWKDSNDIQLDPKIKQYKDAPIKYTPTKVLKADLQLGSINILFGPRQTGKSTSLKLLIKQLLESDHIETHNIFYFDCEALSTKQEIIDLILTYQKQRSEADKKNPNYILLDEISTIDDWPSAIKWLSDSGKFDNSYLLLTGSSSINLKKSGEFLPGRRRGGKDILYLPIDFFTYYNFLTDQKTEKAKNWQQLTALSNNLKTSQKNIELLYRNFLRTGGYLKAINEYETNSSLLTSVETYKNAIRSELIQGNKKEASTKAVLTKLIRSLTSETSYTNVAQEAELGSKNTAQDYLNFLVDSFFLNQLNYYSIPEKKIKIRKKKKFYPSDPLLLWIFSTYTYSTSDINPFYNKYITPPLNTQLAELFISSELAKKEFEVFYYHNTKELDFYIPKLNLGIESKYKETTTSDDLKSLVHAERKFITSINTLERKDDIHIIPTYLVSFIDWENFS